LRVAGFASARALADAIASVAAEPFEGGLAAEEIAVERDDHIRLLQHILDLLRSAEGDLRALDRRGVVHRAVGQPLRLGPARADGITQAVARRAGHLLDEERQ